MARTTIDIDGPLLLRLKRLAKRQGKSLGRLVSELLAGAIARESETPRPRALTWNAQPMRARVDLEDKDAVYAALEGR